MSTVAFEKPNQRTVLDALVLTRAKRLLAREFLGHSYLDQLGP
jgi:hypothetical protein